MGIRSFIYKNIDWILEKFSFFLAPVISYMGLYGIGSEKFLRSGVLPVPIDHYQPVPDIHELQKREVWKKISNLPGVDWRPEHQLNNLYKIAEKFKTECKWPYEKPIDSSKFYLGNETFSFGCAASLHCMIRYYKPDRIIEVGSGNSSLIIHEAITLNYNENNKSVQYTVIDPYPRREIVEKIHNDTEIIINKVENINLAKFKDLYENDILFIDSSHMAKIGSDVNYLILDVLPNLNQGVIIHFHDIPMPYEYPEVYALNPKFRVFWNESYLLQAFLSCNNKFEILMGMRYLMTTYVDEFSSIFPFFDENRHPIISSSFWIKKMSFNDKKQ